MSAAAERKEWDVRTPRLKRAQRRGSAVAWYALFGAFLYGLLTGSELWFLGAQVIFLLVLAASIAAHRFWRPLRRLAVAEDGVFLDGEPLGEVLSAFATDASGTATVTVTARRGRAWPRFVLRLDVEDMACAREIVRALRRENEARFFREWFFRPNLALLLVGALLASALLVALGRWSHIEPWMGGLAGVLAYFPSLVGSIHWLIIGDDGVHIRTSFRKRFIPFSEVLAVERIGLLAKIVAMRLRTNEQVILDPLLITTATLCEDKLVAALERYRLHAIAERTPTLVVNRGNRSAREWISLLRNVGSTSIDYRVAATSTEDLVRVLRDQSADAIARAAAAVSLDALDPKATERIRVVAAETANPKLRIALERIADHADDAEIGARLDALEVMKR